MKRIVKKQKQEAIERMKMLSLHENAINEFDKENKLNKSIQGMLYWLDEEEEKIIKDWQEEMGGLAYHVIRSTTEFGELFAIFYVSVHESEWPMDREDIGENRAIVCVKNMTDDICSDYGSIGFKQFAGGLIRMY